MTENIHTLVVRARGGDTDALTQLLRDHGPKIQSRLDISAKWRSVLDPDDVMQVTYLEAFLRIGHLKSESMDSFIAWLSAIAQNNIRDAVSALNSRKRPNPDRQVGQPYLGDSEVRMSKHLSAEGQLRAASSRAKKPSSFWSTPSGTSQARIKP